MCLCVDGLASLSLLDITTMSVHLGLLWTVQSRAEQSSRCSVDDGLGLVVMCRLVVCSCDYLQDTAINSSILFLSAISVDDRLQPLWPTLSNHG